MPDLLPVVYIDLLLTNLSKEFFQLLSVILNTVFRRSKKPKKASSAWLSFIKRFGLQISEFVFLIVKLFLETSIDSQVKITNAQLYQEILKDV